jgi:N-dimethylarginine dimethylaminohydrolase
MDISLMEATRGLPDMVFTANAGLVWENKFIVSNFRHNVRQEEARHFESWFASRNLESLGFSVFEILLAEFIKAGGSAKCLVLRIP